MSAVNLSLSVFPDPDGFRSRVFLRDSPWPFLPRDDDTIYVLNRNEDGEVEWWGDARLQHVFFDADGGVTVQLVPWQIDPSPEVAARTGYTRYRSRWDSEDGDLIELLLASGWTEYRR